MTGKITRGIFKMLDISILVLTELESTSSSVSNRFSRSRILGIRSFSRIRVVDGTIFATGDGDISAKNITQYHNV
jgi:hypothetical protein